MSRRRAKLSSRDAGQIAEHALRLDTPDEVERLLDDRLAIDGVADDLLWVTMPLLRLGDKSSRLLVGDDSTDTPGRSANPRRPLPESHA